MANSNNNTPQPLQTVGNWLKNNWLVIVVVAGVLLFGWWSWTTINSLHKKQDELLKTIEQQHTSSLQQIADIQASYERQQAAQRSIEKEFNDRLQALDQKYADQLDAVRQTRVTRQRHLQANPSELTGAIQQAFNIPSGDTQQP